MSYREREGVCVGGGEGGGGVLGAACGLKREGLTSIRSLSAMHQQLPLVFSFFPSSISDYHTSAIANAIYACITMHIFLEIEHISITSAEFSILFMS